MVVGLFFVSSDGVGGIDTYSPPPQKKHATNKRLNHRALNGGSVSENWCKREHPIFALFSQFFPELESVGALSSAIVFGTQFRCVVHLTAEGGFFVNNNVCFNFHLVILQNYL